MPHPATLETMGRWIAAAYDIAGERVAYHTLGGVRYRIGLSTPRHVSGSKVRVSVALAGGPERFHELADRTPDDVLRVLRDLTTRLLEEPAT